jgi:hypothetical protein
VTVLARHGYFALADTAPVPPKNHKEEIEQLGQIAASPVDATQVPVYVRLMSPSGVTQLLTQVYFNPRSELKNGSDGRWTGSFQIEFLQLDDKNHVLDATEKSLDVNLLPADFPNVAQHGLEVPASLPSMPHAAVLCVIVRDRNSDAIGSVRIPLEKYAGNQTGRDK